MLFNIRFVSHFFDSSFSYGRPSKEREREREESSQCCSIDTDALAREMRIQSKFSSFNFISTWRVRGHFFSMNFFFSSWSHIYIPVAVHFPLFIPIYFHSVCFPSRSILWPSRIYGRNQQMKDEDNQSFRFFFSLEFLRCICIRSPYYVCLDIWCIYDIGGSELNRIASMFTWIHWYNVQHSVLNLKRRGKYAKTVSRTCR